MLDLRKPCSLSSPGTIELAYPIRAHTRDSNFRPSEGRYYTSAPRTVLYLHRSLWERASNEKRLPSVGISAKIYSPYSVARNVTSASVSQLSTFKCLSYDGLSNSVRPERIASSDPVRDQASLLSEFLAVSGSVCLISMRVTGKDNSMGSATKDLIRNAPT